MLDPRLDLGEIVSWFNAIRAARFSYLKTPFPTASDSEVAIRRKAMEKDRRSSKQYGSLESTKRNAESAKDEDIVSMADSTITIDDIEGELFKIERIRDVLVRRESELRYIFGLEERFHLTWYLYSSTNIKVELPPFDYKHYPCVPGPTLLSDRDKSKEDKLKEDELLQQIHKLVETRDFLVDDVEFERLREREEDKEMADFLQSKLPTSCIKKTNPIKDKKLTSRAQQTSTPFTTKTGLTLLKECCGFTCSIM
ncbi:hypothetical protein EOD39_4916 [Acipenser ruthenus]|uniref:BMERB domain-containing protein n=1 Tax=Acipenser ruthenus TaxID=7906 RepID=A0A444UGD8_ACIRT|nr:hypothetical protein EOD39_4916 [Acipenser ruthenus]